MTISLSTFKEQYVQSAIVGSVITLALAPFINAANRVSVVACKMGLSTSQSLKAIIRGQVDKASPSIWLLQKGAIGYLSKEATRILFKPVVLSYKPKIDEFFSATASRTGALRSSIAMTAALSGLEVVFHPLDTLRVRIQSGKPAKTLLEGSPFRQMYAGSLGSGTRLSIAWWLFFYSDAILDKWLRDHSSILPHSLLGALIKAPLESAILNAFIYPIERLKNEIQMDAEITAMAKKMGGSVYRQAWNAVQTRRGPIGMIDGLAAKIISNSFFVVNSQLLVALGRERTIPLA